MIPLQNQIDSYVGSRIIGALFKYCRAEHIILDDYETLYELLHSVDGEELPEDEASEEDDNFPNDVYHIWKDGDYIVIGVGFISMMFNDDDIEGFLCERWRQTRKSLLGWTEISYGHDIAFLSDQGLGIRLEAYAAIGGYNEGGDFPRATLFTPDDIKWLLSKYGS